jgi:hypothetical protein
VHRDLVGNVTVTQSLALKIKGVDGSRFTINPRVFAFSFECRS